ncbi:MAG: hypothetical protein GY717_20835 [Rhodobacteraceae bacterium]|nr:hypothetical protein [Paracoccaceae bacterium]
MGFLPGLLLALAVSVGVADGLGKLIETPRLVAVFAANGIAPEILGLYGVVQVIAAVLLVVPRTRRAAAAVLVAGLGSSAWLMWQTAETQLAMLSGTAALPVLAVAMRRRGPRAPRAYSLPILGPRQ